MLVDGTNPEGVDPSPPLNWVSKNDIKNVVIYGGPTNPPVTKIRAHLTYNSIPYTCVNRTPNKQPKGSYQKVPSIVVDGRQVNDSYVILKFLVPALYGNLSEQDLLWEEKITYGAMIAMEVEAFEDPDSVSSILAMARKPGFLSWFSFFLPIGGPGHSMPTGIRNRRAKPEKVEKYGELKKFSEYLGEFKDAQGDKSFFGGENPSATDISLFATLKAFKTVLYVEQALQEAGLADWYKRVETKMPSLDKDTFE